MVKQKTLWYCSECGHKQAKWSGQCTQCSLWNTFAEEAVVTTKKKHISKSSSPSKPVRISEVQLSKETRFSTHIEEFDRLLGGGLVKGSLSLLGGEPGIGKSTLLMQTAHFLAEQGLLVLYVCGEESVTQSSLRARRLGLGCDGLFLLNETHLGSILAQIDTLNPDCVIIDSIQILYKDELSSAPGSVSQVREIASDLMHLAKNRDISIFLVGHVTKSGELAGPRVLEHLVDTVLYFEGDKQHHYRMVRVVKNRFGPTDEIAVFQMGTTGLKQVPNPSEIFLEERKTKVPGSVIIPTLEGSRPILVEVQALVTDTVFPSPYRRCAGLDLNRITLLLAVLEKRLRYRLYGCDVFVSVVGGLKVVEPSVDLGVILAIAASFRNKPFPAHTCVVGEVGLGGELRSVSRIDLRLKEAIRMGFTSCIIPKRNLKGLDSQLRKAIEIQGVDMVEEAVSYLN